MLEPLKLGSRMEMSYVNGKKNQGDDRVYVSQILDFNDENGIVCAMPIYEGHIVPLQEGKRLDTYFYVGTKIYKATCTVRKRGKEENVHTVTLSVDSSIVKVQRREYYRLSCLMTVNVLPITENQADKFVVEHTMPDITQEKDTCTMTDISGGGARILTENVYEKGSYVLLEINLHIQNEDKLKTIVGKIVATNKNANNDLLYDVRMQYYNINDNDRNDVIKYVFEQQRNQLKKELG